MNNDKSWIDDIGGVRWTHELVKVFGAPHAARFFGWCVLLGAAMRENDTQTDAVERLALFGFSRATGYRMLADIREFQKHLKEIVGEEPPLYVVVKRVQSEGLYQIENDAIMA